MEKTGWLKKQFDKVEQEIREWPEWKKSDGAENLRSEQDAKEKNNHQSQEESN